jgi:hypothetical protein
VAFIQFFKNLIFIAMIVCFCGRVTSFGYRHLNDYSHATSVASLSQQSHILKDRRATTHARYAHFVDHANPLNSISAETGRPIASWILVQKNTAAIDHSGPLLTSSVPLPPPSFV